MNVPVLHTHRYRDGSLRLVRTAPPETVVVPLVEADSAQSTLHIVRSSLPAWSGGNHGEYVALEHIYERVLLAASKQGVDSIALPMVVDESSGFPLDRAIRVIFSTVFRFFREHNAPPRDVSLVVDTERAYDLSAQVLAIAARTYLGTSTEQN